MSTTHLWHGYSLASTSFPKLKPLEGDSLPNAHVRMSYMPPYAFHPVNMPSASYLDILAGGPLVSSIPRVPRRPLVSSLHVLSPHPYVPIIKEVAVT
jgi:hypothetical protein